METGSRDYCTHVVKNGKVLLAFTCALNPGNVDFHKYIETHGDGVHDVAFTVEDARKTYEIAVSRGAKSIQEPEELKDEYGSVVTAAVQTYGDTVHTFVQ